MIILLTYADTTPREDQSTHKIYDCTKANQSGSKTHDYPYPETNHNLIQMIKCHEDSLLRLHHLTSGRQVNGAYEGGYQGAWYSKDLQRPYIKPVEYLAHYEDSLRRKYEEPVDGEREKERVCCVFCFNIR